MCYHEIEQKIQRYSDFNGIKPSRIKRWLREGGYSDINEQSEEGSEGGQNQKKVGEVLGSQQKTLFRSVQ